MTLVELVIALAILGIGSAVAAVATKALKPTRAGQLVDSLNQWRALAILSGTPVSVRMQGVPLRFNPDGTSSSSLLRLDSVNIRITPLTGELHVTPK